MLSTEEANDITDRIKYPNLSVIYYDYPPQLYMGISCVDIHDQAPTQVGITVPISPETLEDEETFLKFIFLVISAGVLHEMAEQFVFDGKRVFDPHAEKQEFSVNMLAFTSKAKLEMGGNLKFNNLVVMPYPTSVSVAPRMAPKAPTASKGASGPWAFKGLSFKKDADPGRSGGATLLRNKQRMVKR